MGNAAGETAQGFVLLTLHELALQCLLAGMGIGLRLGVGANPLQQTVDALAQLAELVVAGHMHRSGQQRPLARHALNLGVQALQAAQQQPVQQPHQHHTRQQAESERHRHGLPGD